MSLIALGINHHTAPVAIREQASFTPDRLGQSLGELRRLQGVQEAAIVSTCNRTEIYLGCQHAQTTEVTQWLHQAFALRDNALQPYLFSHVDRQAVRHLLRVCSGLDSLILGEPQILGQIKQAYAAAEHDGSLGPELKRLFQHAFSVAKQVRTDTQIGANAVSVAFAAVQLARKVFGDMGNQTAFMLGAGETTELAARHLLTAGVGRVVIVNRTLERAEALAKRLNLRERISTCALGELHSVLHQADIIIAATASPVPVLGKGAVESALRARKRRHMLMIDIAVPRDIEPQVNDIDDVFLYGVDDLNGIIEEGRRSRERAALQAESIIEHESDQFMRWLQSRGAQQTIQQLHQQAEQARQRLLEKAQAQLESGRPAEQVLEQLSKQLTNKLLHAPSQAIRQAGETEDHHTLRAAHTLFGIDAKSSPQETS